MITSSKPSGCCRSCHFPSISGHVPEIAGGHHERLDGTGYPKRLRGEELSLQARMMAIADIFEALTARDRPYKKGKTLSEAIEIMARMRRERPHRRRAIRTVPDFRSVSPLRRALPAPRANRRSQHRRGALAGCRYATPTPEGGSAAPKCRLRRQSNQTASDSFCTRLAPSIFAKGCAPDFGGPRCFAPCRQIRRSEAIMFGKSATFAVALAILAASGCASFPGRDPALDDARLSLDAARRNPQVAMYASAEFDQAAVTLRQADDLAANGGGITMCTSLPYLRTSVPRRRKTWRAFVASRRRSSRSARQRMRVSRRMSPSNRPQQHSYKRRKRSGRPIRHGFSRLPRRPLMITDAERTSRCTRHP